MNDPTFNGLCSVLILILELCSDNWISNTINYKQKYAIGFGDLDRDPFCSAQTPHGSSSLYTFAAKLNRYLVAVLVSLAMVLIH
jgi:hypothetical protein